MYCPSCGKEIPNNSAFCLYCGKSVNLKNVSASIESDWEYKDFVWNADYRAQTGTIGKMGSVSYSDVIQHAWVETRPHLLDGLQDWLDKGWEPLTPIGPDCMIVETENAGFLGGTKIFLTGVRVKMRRHRELGSLREIKQESRKSEFDVIILSCGRNKNEVIKAIRELKPKIGLGEAKKLAETPGTKILIGVNRSMADSVASKLKRAGASVEIQ